MKAVELFAGAGGLGIGVSKAGFSPVEIVEWDRWCCDTINQNRSRNVKAVANWPEPHHGDIRPRCFKSLEGKVDLVSGGPPCQPFSLGGKHKSFDDSRDMWPQAVRVVRETRPKAFIFENVKGLTRAAFAAYLSYIQLQLHHPALERRLDEDWKDHFGRLQQHHSSKAEIEPEYRVLIDVLNAADYGVPQKRERVVFVGFRSDLGIPWRFPKGQFSFDALLWDLVRSENYWDRHEVASRDRQIDDRLRKRAMGLHERPAEKAWRTVRDAIHDLPDPSSSEGGNILNHRQQPGARSYPGHTGSPLDLPAKTLKAGVHGVPGGENMLLRRDGAVRYFTVRESARLQTFPDDYELHGSWSEAMRQLGNAVPVDLAHVVAKDVARHIRQVA
jgi:DNA (cytosine-5)-methyltransferase 1